MAPNVSSLSMCNNRYNYWHVRFQLRRIVSRQTVVDKQKIEQLNFLLTTY